MSAARRADGASLLQGALRRHGAELSRFVRARVPEPEASDLLQLAFLRAAEHVADLEDPERARAWLFRITRNAIADAGRAKRSRAWLVLAESAPEPDVDVEVERCACSVHLAKGLPPTHAEILALVDLGDASVKEAAATLGITANGASVRLHRAREALRRRLREHCGVSSARDCADCRCANDGCCGG